MKSRIITRSSKKKVIFVKPTSKTRTNGHGKVIDISMHASSGLGAQDGMAEMRNIKRNVDLLRTHKKDPSAIIEISGILKELVSGRTQAIGHFMSSGGIDVLASIFKEYSRNSDVIEEVGLLAASILVDDNRPPETIAEFAKSKKFETAIVDALHANSTNNCALIWICCIFLAITSLEDEERQKYYLKLGLIEILINVLILSVEESMHLSDGIIFYASGILKFLAFHPIDYKDAIEKGLIYATTSVMYKFHNEISLSNICEILRRVATGAPLEFTKAVIEDSNFLKHENYRSFSYFLTALEKTFELCDTNSEIQEDIVVIYSIVFENLKGILVQKGHENNVELLKLLFSLDVLKQVVSAQRAYPNHENIAVCSLKIALCFSEVIKSSSEYRMSLANIILCSKTVVSNNDSPESLNLQGSWVHTILSVCKNSKGVSKELGGVYSTVVRLNHVPLRLKMEVCVLCKNMNNDRWVDAIISCYPDHVALELRFIWKTIKAGHLTTELLGSIFTVVKIAPFIDILFEASGVNKAMYEIISVISGEEEEEGGGSDNDSILYAVYNCAVLVAAVKTRSKNTLYGQETQEDKEAIEKKCVENIVYDLKKFKSEYPFSVFVHCDFLESVVKMSRRIRSMFVLDYDGLMIISDVLRDNKDVNDDNNNEVIINESNSIIYCCSQIILCLVTDDNEYKKGESVVTLKDMVCKSDVLDVLFEILYVNETMKNETRASILSVIGKVVKNNVQLKNKVVEKGWIHVLVCVVTKYFILSINGDGNVSEINSVVEVGILALVNVMEKNTKATRIVLFSMLEGTLVILINKCHGNDNIKTLANRALSLIYEVKYKHS